MKPDKMWLFLDLSNYFTKKETQFTHILSTKKHASLSKLHETGPRSPRDPKNSPDWLKMVIIQTIITYFLVVGSLSNFNILLHANVS